MKEENAPAQPADADLPPEVPADQCLLEAEKAMNTKLPPEFFFLYGKFLTEKSNVVNLAKAVENRQVQNFLDNLLKARSFLKQFLTQAERIAANYKAALELLASYESTIKAVTSAAKEFEELQKFKNKKAGETLLIHLDSCYSELVSAPLNAATDVHAKNNNDETPLHNAAEKGQFQVVEALLAAGADVNAKQNSFSDNTPFHVAALLGNTKVVEALLASSANVHAKNKRGETSLHEAAEEGQIEIVKALLVAGADTEAMNKYGETPLDLARKRGKTEVVKILRSAVKKTKPEDHAPFQVKKPKRKRRKFFAILGRIVDRVRAQFLKSSGRLF